jgi:hypothetical protein
MQAEECPAEKSEVLVRPAKTIRTVVDFDRFLHRPDVSGPETSSFPTDSEIETRVTKSFARGHKAEAVRFGHGRPHDHKICVFSLAEPDQLFRETNQQQVRAMDPSDQISRRHVGGAGAQRRWLSTHRR